MYAKSYPKKYLKPDHKEKYKTKLDLNSNLEIKKKWFNISIWISGKPFKYTCMWRVTINVMNLCSMFIKKKWGNCMKIIIHYVIVKFISSSTILDII